MPRLPDFSSLGQTPPPQTPLSVARVDVQPLEFTVRQGPGVAAIHGGHELAQAGLQMQDHIDTLMAEDAYNKLIAKRVDLESSPANGFVNVKGSAAIDLKFYDDYNQRFGDAANGIETGLTNKNQQQLFRNRAAIAGAQYQSALLSHMSHQTSAFADNTEKTTVALELASASNAPNDAAFDTSISRIRGVIDARGSRLNEPPAQIELEKLKAVDSAWTERIRTTMNNQPLVAQQMYESNKDKISPDNKIIIEHQLHNAILPVQAKNLAMSIIAGAPVGKIVSAVTVGGDNALNGLITDSVQGETAQQPQAYAGQPQTKVTTKANLGQWLADAAEAADKVKPNDPVFRDLVLQQVKGYVNTLMTAQDGQSRAAHGALMSAALGPDGKNKPLVLDDLLTTPELRAAWNVTSPESQRGFFAMFEHNARERLGRPMKVDNHVVESLFNRVHLPSDDLNRITAPSQLAPFFGKGLDQHYYDWLKKEIAQQGTEEGRNLTATREDYLKSVKAQFDKSTLMLPDGKGGEDFNKFRTFVLAQEQAAINSNGKINPYDLYNYKSDQYISNKIPSFQRTLDEQIKSMNERFRQQGAQTPGTATPIRNPDGSVTTERSITVTDSRLNDGKPTNIPSVWGGKVVPDDEAISNAAKSGRKFDSYTSVDSAVKAAKARSDALGRGEVTSIGGASGVPTMTATNPTTNEKLISTDGGKTWQKP